ncbi:MAG TPA: hypothetical protein VEK79_25550 [Thermoanaerobaculia bacterium]|nr:hypothetical protein [Thermoanaerobaculia bacterium]
MDEHRAFLFLAEIVVVCAAIAGIAHHTRTFIRLLTWLVRHAKEQYRGIVQDLRELYRELRQWNVDEARK